MSFSQSVTISALKSSFPMLELVFGAGSPLRVSEFGQTLTLGMGLVELQVVVVIPEVGASLGECTAAVGVHIL